MFMTAAVPASLALIAFLNAHAVSSLIDGTISAATVMPSVAEAHAAEPAVIAIAQPRPRADAILDRNPFDHVTGPLRQPGADGHADLPVRDLDLATAPLCEGVRPLVLVGADDQNAAFASLEYGGKHLLRKRGGEVGAARVAYVGRDRLWLEGRMGLCQALLFGAPPPAKVADPPAARGQTQLEIDLGKQIAKTGPNEYAIERSAVERIIEAQSELMKSRIVQDKEGDRVVGMKITGIKPGSVLSMLGIENGDRLETINGFEVSNPEKMLEAYARLRSEAEKLQIRVSRAGKPMNLDYVIR
jgi:general secretion pathway protein C